MRDVARSKLVVFLVFLVLGFGVYLPSLEGPFQFDDLRIVLDEKVRDRRSIWGYVVESVKFSQETEGALGPRSLVHASFLANWQLGGESTIGYHMVNALIHVVSAWLVYVLVKQILDFLSEKRIKGVGKKGLNKWVLAMVGGLVFLLHPLQSQAVAYISQRFVAMATMFYLTSVVFYLQARKIEIKDGKKGNRVWRYYVISLAAALAALSSKEIAITLPLMMIFMEILVIRKGLRGRVLILALYFLLAAKIPLQVIFNADLGGMMPTVADVANQASAVEHRDLAMTRWTYFLTQFNVVSTYVRLLFVPVGQSIDYDYPLTTKFFEGATPLSLVFLVGILGMGFWSYRRGGDKRAKGKREWSLLSLSILWFFLGLSVTSTIIPIRDVIYEHRVYLSMVGYALFFVFLVQKLYERFGKKVSYGVVVVLLIYGGLTFQRSRVWASELALWGDAWEKAPDKDRTNKNYGFVLTQEGRLSEGIKLLEKAVKLNPDDQNYRITLGAAYLRTRNWNKSLEQFEKAVDLDPTKADGWNNKGVALFQLKKYPESIEAFESAIEVDNDFAMAWLGLGGAKMMHGEIDAGEKALFKVLEIEVDEPRAWSNLLVLYIQSKQWQKAWEAVEKLEAIDPDALGLAERKRLVLEMLK